MIQDVGLSGAEACTQCPPHWNKAGTMLVPIGMCFLEKYEGHPQHDRPRREVPEDVWPFWIIH